MGPLKRRFNLVHLSVPPSDGRLNQLQAVLLLEPGECHPEERLLGNYRVSVFGDDPVAVLSEQIDGLGLRAEGAFL